MDQKRCSTCGLEKPLSDFHKDRNRPDGRRSACRVCRSQKNSIADIYQTNPIPPPPENEDERRLLARQRAIKDVVQNHYREFLVRYDHHLGRLEVQHRWHSVELK